MGKRSFVEDFLYYFFHVGALWTDYALCDVELRQVGDLEFEFSDMLQMRWGTAQILVNFIGRMIHTRTARCLLLPCNCQPRLIALILTITIISLMSIRITITSTITIIIDIVLIASIPEHTKRIQTLLFLAQSHPQSYFLANIKLVHYFHCAVY